MRNLTELSLKNKNIVWYFIIVVFVAGIFSYFNLGRREDPSFTIRQMIVTVRWPGATAQQMQDNVTDKLAKKLQDTPGLDYLKSYSRDSLSVIYVTLKQEVPADKVHLTWLKVRNLAEDARPQLPDGVIGPVFNDQFDDVYGSVYAITGKDYSYEELRQKAEAVRRVLLGVPGVGKAELLGVQPQKIYVEAKADKLSELGISPQAIQKAISAQNEMAPAGMIATKSNDVYIHMTGKFNDLAQIRATPINVGGKIFRLGDIATVKQGYADPRQPQMYFDGQPAIGIAVSMVDGGNILSLGKSLDKTIGVLRHNLPLGIEIHQVSNQPQVVRNSISEFVSTLEEAVVIVLAVSFFSLGWRTGLVVAGCIPLVIAGVFNVMDIFGITLNKVSLGALIIALGLLVDDAIIAVEMMSVKLEEGLGRFDAACYAYKATAAPMLTGTLITCSGFIPVAFSKGMAAEFCRDLFPVIATALIISWIVSVMVAPLYGYKLIKVKVKSDASGKINPYQSRFYRLFKRLLIACLHHKKIVLLVTGGVFALSLFLLHFVPKEFFPPSMRPEIIVEMSLPQGSSMQATKEQAERFAAYLDTQKKDIKNYSYYIGEGAPRFVLTLNPVLPEPNYAQFVIVAKDVKARKRLISEINNKMQRDFPAVQSNIKLIQTGPPADYPVMLRIEGYDISKVQAIAGKVAALMRQDKNLYNINFDWNSRVSAIKLEIDPDKLSVLGISRSDLAKTLYAQINGIKAAQYYKGDNNTDITFRLNGSSRTDIEKLKDMPIYLGKSGYVPLDQLAKITYEGSNGLIWWRNFKPAITVRADIHSGTANDATQIIYDKTLALRQSLPYGYSIDIDGSLHDSMQSMQFLMKPIPVMFIVIMTLLMFQLKKISLMVLTLLTAPLGIIGVSFGMLISSTPIGFVADLGILALTGMIIRNSIILIDQIKKHMAAGETAWNAIVDSAIMRFRPIMLTAMAAILGMVPLMPSPFWGPMAVAISSGLLVATVLTLLVLPTMYAAWFKVKEEK